MFADVQTKVVDDATQHNVFVGLEWLKQAATSRDLAIVFWSGHGFLDNRQKFWFLTREADIQQLRATAVSKDDLLEYVAELPGKKVLFIDACHAGAAMAAGSKAVDTSPDMNKVVNDFALRIRPRRLRRLDRDRSSPRKTISGIATALSPRR